MRSIGELKANAWTQGSALAWGLAWAWSWGWAQSWRYWYYTYEGSDTKTLTKKLT